MKNNQWLIDDISASILRFICNINPWQFMKINDMRWHYLTLGYLISLHFIRYFRTAISNYEIAVKLWYNGPFCATLLLECGLTARLQPIDDRRIEKNVLNFCWWKFPLYPCQSLTPLFKIRAGIFPRINSLTWIPFMNKSLSACLKTKLAKSKAFLSLPNLTPSLKSKLACFPG